MRRAKTIFSASSGRPNRGSFDRHVTSSRRLELRNAYIYLPHQARSATDEVSAPITLIMYMAAVSVRRTRGPNSTGSAPASRSAVTSVSVKPPSGPMMQPIELFLALPAATSQDQDVDYKRHETRQSVSIKRHPSSHQGEKNSSRYSRTREDHTHHHNLVASRHQWRDA